MAETEKSTKHESLVSSNYRFTLLTKRFLPQKVYLVICIGVDGCNVELPPPGGAKVYIDPCGISACFFLGILIYCVDRSRGEYWGGSLTWNQGCERIDSRGRRSKGFRVKQLCIRSWHSRVTIFLNLTWNKNK